MEESKEKSLEEILSDAQAYIDTRVAYTKLSILEKTSKMFADLISNATVIICFVLALSLIHI